MRTRLMASLSSACIALLFSAAIATSASAQATKTSVCKDGSTSTTAGKGACSGHGGVDAKATSTASKALKTAAKADVKADKADAKADKKVAKAADKAAATKQVKCTDGTLSKGGRGACSGHGGIAKSGK